MLPPGGMAPLWDESRMGRWTDRWDARSRALRALAPGWLWAAFIGVLVSLTFHALFTTRFDQNDDVAFLIALSGWNGDLSSPGIVWSSILLSQPLLWLYAAWPEVEWYVLYLVTAHGVTAGLLVWLYPPRGDRLFHQGLFLLLLGSLLLPLWLRLQFTSLAVLMSATGVLLVVRGCDRERAGEGASKGARDKDWLGPALVGGLMLGFGSLVRASAAWFALAWTLPIIVVSVRRVPRKQWLRFGVCALVVIGLGQAGKTIYYGSEPWPSYIDYVHQSSQLMDTQDKHRIAYRAVREAGGWSANDVAIFRSWVFPDQRVHSLDSMKRLVAAARSNQHGRSKAELLERVDAQRQAHQGAFSLVFLLVGLLLWRSPPRLRWWTLAFVGWLGALLLYLALFRKMPDRVIVPAALTAGLVLLHQLERVLADERIAPLKWLPLLLLLTVLSGGGPTHDVEGLSQTSARNEAGVARLQTQLAAIEEVDPKAVILAQPTSLPYRLWPVAYTSMARTELTFLGSGWGSHHPLNHERLRKLGIEQVVPTLFERDHHYLLAKERFMPLFETYAAEHHRLEVVVRDKWLINVEQDAWLYRLAARPLPKQQAAP